MASQTLSIHARRGYWATISRLEAELAAARVVGNIYENPELMEVLDK